jgi:BMFP domain-containing protein YqiC
MQSQNRLLDDLAKLASGAIGTLRDARGEVEGRLRERFESILANMDLVTREEFEAVKEMAARAREENEALAARIARLEKQPRKPRARKSAAANTGGTASAATTTRPRA